MPTAIPGTENAVIVRLTRRSMSAALSGARGLAALAGPESASTRATTMARDDGFRFTRRTLRWVVRASAGTHPPSVRRSGGPPRRWDDCLLVRGARLDRPSGEPIRHQRPL